MHARPLLRRALPLVASGVLAASLSLAAHAQTFRGLAPGMDVSATQVLPDPYQTYELQSGFTGQQWDLQDDQQLSVVNDADGRIVLLTANDYTPRGQIRFEETTAAEVEALLGSPGGYFDTAMAVSGLGTIGIWSVVWPLDAEASGFILVEFRGPWDREIDDDRANPPLPVPAEAVVRAITLVHRDGLAAGRGMDGDFVPREGTQPIALPLSDLFTL